MRPSTAHLADIRRAFRWAVALAGAMAVLSVAIVASVGLTGEQILRATDTVAPLWLGTVIATALGLLIIIAHLRRRLLERAALWAKYTIAKDVLEESMAVSDAAAPLRRGGCSTAALDSLSRALTGNAAVAASDAPWLALAVVAIAALDGRSGLFAGALVAVGYVVTAAAFGRRKMTQGSAISGRRGVEAAAASALADSQAALIRTLGLEKGVVSSFAGARGAEVAVTYERLQSEGRWRLVAQIVAVFGTLGAMALAIDGVRDGHMDRLRAAVLVAAAVWLAHQIYTLIAAVPQLRAARDGWHVLLAQSHSVARATRPNEGAVGSLQIVEASVAYLGRGQPALEGVTLYARPGEAIGICGPASSGKSTLAALAAGAVSPTMGRVETGGLRIGYVPDGAMLLAGSVGENIARFGKIEPSSLRAAALRAGVGEILDGLPLGYSTPVSASSGAPHGGLTLREARAVALARALVSPIDILVIDSPELAMEPRDVYAIVAALSRLRASGVGLVIASNDPRFHALADRFVQLDHGAVVAANVNAHCRSAPSMRVVHGDARVAAR